MVDYGRLWFFFILLVSSATFAEPLLLLQKQDSIDLNPHLDYLKDETGLLSFKQIQGPQSTRFTPVHGHMISSGFSPSTYWFRLSYDNRTGQELNLVFRTLTFANVTVRLIKPGNFNTKSTTSGASIPYSKRELSSSLLGMPVTIARGTGLLYWRVESKDPVNIEFRLEDPKNFARTARIHDLTVSAVISIMLMLSFVLLYRAVIFRSRLLLVLSGFGCLFCLFHLSVSGFMGFMIDEPYADLRARNGFGLMAVAALMLAVPKLIQEPLNKYFYYCWLVSLLTLACAGLYSLHVSATEFTQATLTFAIAGQIAGLILFIFGHRAKNYWLYAAIIFFTLTSFIQFLSATGLIKHVLTSFWLVKLFSLASLVFLVIGSLRFESKTPEVGYKETGIVNASEIQWRILQKLNHDLRTPINGILGMSELLNGTHLSANQYEYIQTIQNAGAGLLNTADEIKSLSRIISNRMTPEFDTIDLADFLHEVTLPFARLASLKNVELITDISYQVPAFVNGDRQMLGQVISILLDNAVKHTEKGEILVQVSRTSNSQVRFRVTDTGSGILSDRIPRLFDFEQPDSSRTVCLGLPIAQRVIKVLGGQLSVSSEPKTGSTFWFTLELPAVDSPPQELSETQDLRKLRILIVDDNMTCRKVMEHQANSWGVTVDTVSSGQEALALLHTQFHLHHGYDIVVLDHQMPKMNGTQLAQKIKQDRQINRELVLIMMSGLDLREQDDEVKDAGIHFLLVKPVSSKQFQQALLRALPKINKP